MKIKYFLYEISIRYFCRFQGQMNQSRIEKINNDNIFLKQNLPETGRSVVEILGVLAVIGVLSVGGIMGYRFAMDKYRANDIVNEVNLRSTDIWNRYQNIPLPDPSETDVSDFPEYAEFTPAGFPIDATSHPDVAFRIHVSNVPSGVCKQVLNMPLINVIKGLQYIQVNDVKYENTTQICGEDKTDNVMVFTSFLDSENDMGNGNHCVEDSECTSACGVATCNDETMTCTDGCTGNTNGKNVCLQSTGECVECLVNADCKSKGRGYICSETTHECEKMLKTCPEGTFRTRNGACVACDNGSNFFVYKNGEPYPDSSDEADGYTMCQACNPTRQYGESLDDPEVGYCSYMCTIGISYQTQDGRCVSCADTRRNIISTDTVSTAQCEACPNHIWWAYDVYNSQSFYCGLNFTCPEGQFKTNTGCVDCTKQSFIGILSPWKTSYPAFYQEMKDSCNNCPEYVNGVYAKRYVNKTGTHCINLCEQPESGSEADTICRENPKSPKCKRQWQSAHDGKCYSCDAVVSWNQVDNGGIELCEKCGRTVSSDGRCYLPVTCPLGQVATTKGTCVRCPMYPGNNGKLAVESDELSGCSANCRMKNGEYSADEDAQPTAAYVEVSSSQKYCIPKCPEGYFLGGDYICYPCSAEYGVAYLNDENCEKACPNEPYKRYKTTRVASKTTCNLSYCKDAADGTKRFLGNYWNAWDVCNRCDTTDNNRITPDVLGKNACSVCSQRIAIPERQNRCFLVDPGVSVICNSIENPELPDYLDETIRRKAEPYLRGDHDGELFRRVVDSPDFYKCVSCDYEGSVGTTQAQCNSCKNRRFENGTCLKGLCEERYQFLNASGTCVACSNENVAINPKKENLCASCSNRRQLETGSEAAGNWVAKCVETCAGAQWQDINGNCLLCHEGGDREIGTDAESRSMCTKCENRKAVEKKDTDGNIVGYRCEEIE